MPAMDDRRQTRRKYSTKLLGHLVDITPAGAMLISEHELPAGQLYRLRLELSPEVAALPFLEFEARSLWCHVDVNPKFYNTGFELTGLTHDSVAIIERIVEAYGFRDN
jgi:hypothetical protein